ncbi:MAG: diacylglycerol kinase family protein [Clostridiaceae bacterium]|nr:diacylglycerol kinase family protein [Eubacteriales bacterium]
MRRHLQAKLENPPSAHPRHTVKFSFACALSGLCSSVKRERSMKIHLAVAALVIAGGAFFRISAIEWLACLAFFALVLGAELMNTALEAAVDLASPEKNDQAKLAKDTAAAAVLVCAALAAVAGCVIFLPKLWALIFG